MQAKSKLKAWLSWATCSRLESIKKLANRLKQRLDGVRGMLDNRSNADVKAMNGLLQQVKRPVRGIRTAANVISITYLKFLSSSIYQAIC